MENMWRLESYECMKRRRAECKWRTCTRGVARERESGAEFWRRAKNGCPRMPHSPYFTRVPLEENNVRVGHTNTPYYIPWGFKSAHGGEHQGGVLSSKMIVIIINTKSSLSLRFVYEAIELKNTTLVTIV